MTWTPAELEDKILAFVLESLERPVEISYHDRLLDKGYIPSMQLINLVGFLEDNFGVEIVPFDVTPDNFESIAAIADLVRSLRGSP